MVRLGLALKCTEPPYHRCVIISDTKSEDDFVVLVRITDNDGNWPDIVCILEPEDWDQLNKSSTVAYSTANCGKSKAALENAIKGGMFEIIPSPSEEILALICKLGRGYPFTPPLAKKHIAEY